MAIVRHLGIAQKELLRATELLYRLDNSPLATGLADRVHHFDHELVEIAGKLLDIHRPGLMLLCQAKAESGVVDA